MKVLIILSVFFFLFSCQDVDTQNTSTDQDVDENNSTVEAATVEVVFVLDATGSMTSLIEGAKRKIWDIANKIMVGEPTPIVKIGLVVYRDRGDQFVVKGYDLTDDIDEVYNNLIAVKADGGGDFPEDVNRALEYAVDSISWSENDNTLCMIFLVGDANPHMDYNDEKHYDQICKEAIKRDIIINAIRCGNNLETERVWKEIAHFAEGYYTSIDYTTSQDIPTPFDGDLSDLSSQLYSTVLIYGSDELRRDKQALLIANEESSGELSSVSADRSINAAMRGSTGEITSGDLLGQILNKKIAINDLDDEEIPVILKDMTVSEREEYIDSLITEREIITNRIAEITKDRNKYIEENSDSEDNNFDAFVINILKEKAEKININYE